MTWPRIGSVWTIRGLKGASAVVVALTPAERGVCHQVVLVPLYLTDHPKFVPAQDDFKVSATELATRGLPRYAAFWNFTPALTDELEKPLVQLPAHLSEELARVYWATLTGDDYASPRWGPKLPFWRKRSVRHFRAQERALWSALYLRLRAVAEQQSEAQESQKQHATWAVRQFRHLHFGQVEVPLADRPEVASAVFDRYTLGLWDTFAAQDLGSEWAVQQASEPGMVSLVNHHVLVSTQVNFFADMYADPQIFYVGSWKRASNQRGRISIDTSAFTDVMGISAG
jgi:hypothetical protein